MDEIRSDVRNDLYTYFTYSSYHFPMWSALIDDVIHHTAQVDGFAWGWEKSVR